MAIKDYWLIATALFFLNKDYTTVCLTINCGIFHFIHAATSLKCIVNATCDVINAILGVQWKEQTGVFFIFLETDKPRIKIPLLKSTSGSYVFPIKVAATARAFSLKAEFHDIRNEHRKQLLGD